MPNPQRILIVGPRSKVGAPLVDQLCQAGHRPVVASRHPESWGNSAADAIYLDMQDQPAMAEATRGIEAAFVLWPAGVGPIAKTTIPLLQALEAAGCRRVVFLSVFGAGTLKFLPHVAVERWLADSSLDHTILRAGYFMQNLSTTHRVDVCEHNEIFIPAGGGHLAMVDTRDIAEVACHELLTPTKPRATYELTGADTINFHEAAEVFSQVLDRPIAYRAPGLWAFARRWRTRDVDRTLLAFMLVEYAVTRLDRSGRVSPDLEQLLGRKPRKLADFVRDHRDLFAAAPPA